MKLLLGTVQFGLDYGIANKSGIVKKSEVENTLDLAYLNKIDTLDTAHHYGDSEKVLGDLSQGRFNIVTKTPHLSTGAISLTDAFNLSLKNLNLDKLHTLMFHSAKDLMSEKGRDLWKEIRRLKDIGSIKHIGASVYGTDEIDYVLENFEIDTIQLPINIFDQRLIKSGHLERIKEKEIEIHARSVFLQGLVFMKPATLPYFFKDIKPIVQKFNEICAGEGITVLQAALSFVKSLVAIDRIVVGVDTSVQLAEIISAYNSDVQISTDSFSISEKKYLEPYLWEV